MPPSAALTASQQLRFQNGTGSAHAASQLSCCISSEAAAVVWQALCFAVRFAINRLCIQLCREQTLPVGIDSWFADGYWLNLTGWLASLVKSLTCLPVSVADIMGKHVVSSRQARVAVMRLLYCLSRRLYFDELVGRAADRAAKEEKRRARAAEAFRDLLRATKGIDVDTSWDDAMVLIASDRDYQAVSNCMRCCFVFPHIAVCITARVAATSSFQMRRSGMLRSSSLSSYAATAGYEGVLGATYS